MTYWPGSKTPKSTNNAFDWKGKESQITKQTDFVNLNKSKMQSMGVTESRFMTTYSKAKPSVQR